MKKLLILLSILIFIICDKKFNEKLHNKRGKKPYFICCRIKCPKGYTQLRPSCRCVCENGYKYHGECIQYSDSNKCSKGYYYSSKYKKCCSLKRRTCGPIRKTNKTKKIDN